MRWNNMTHEQQQWLRGRMGGCMGLGDCRRCMGLGSCICMGLGSHRRCMVARLAAARHDLKAAARKGHLTAAAARRYMGQPLHGEQGVWCSLACASSTSGGYCCRHGGGESRDLEEEA